MTRTVRLRAYAKLNLGLRILYKRPDGYHELRTVFQTISLADRLDVRFTPARKTTIVIEGTPEIPDNLVEKAARLVLEATRFHADVHFTLKKHIPSGAGLGGGSSDAAAVLLALPVLARRPLPQEALTTIARDLGSDVPFFLYGGTALGLGRGEELYPLPDMPAQRGILIDSGIHSSTADAYRDLSRGLTSIALQNKLVSFQQKIWGGLGSNGADIDGNDFEEVVFARHPKLAAIRRSLGKLGANPAAMSGSGSAIFGMFSDAAKLVRAKKAFPHERVLPISLVSRAKYRSTWRRALSAYTKSDLWPPQSPYAR
jgi:4-diphosphocytidyl-2-C-methyl-D-erythritol kinase